MPSSSEPGCLTVASDRIGPVRMDRARCPCALSSPAWYWFCIKYAESNRARPTDRPQSASGCDRYSRTEQSPRTE